MMTKRQRVEAVIRNTRPDCPPVSCWHHFPPGEITGQAAVDAHLRHFETYDLDFLKVMNDHHYPRGPLTVLQTAADLRKITPQPGDTGPLAAQLDVLRALTRRLGPDVPTCTTVFNPWAVLRQLTRSPSDVHGPPKLDGTDERDDVLTALIKEDRSAVQAAVLAVGQTQAAFAHECIKAGANGIFLSVRDDWVDRPANGKDTYRDVVRPADLIILEAVRHAAFNVLHICGRPLDFKGFAQYPVHVLNWADRAAGPSIAYARDRVTPALAGGVDNLTTLPSGSPEDCAAEVRDALRQAKDRPLMITPGCTFDGQAVPPANIHAMVRAARSGYA